MLLAMFFIHVGKLSNSRSQMFFKTGVLKNFAIFAEKRLCWRLFLINLQDLRLAFSLKKTLQHGRFPMNIARFFYGTSVHCTSPKLYVMMDIRYLKVKFYYCKIRPRSRKNFTIDRSKFLVKICFFLNQDFNSPSKIFLLFNCLLLQRFARS